MKEQDLIAIWKQAGVHAAKASEAAHSLAFNQAAAHAAASTAYSHLLIAYRAAHGGAA